MTIANKLAKGLAFIGFGSLISLISYLYTKDLTLPGAGKIGYGFPLSWLQKIKLVLPYNLPPYYSLFLEDLLIDVAFWTLLVGALYEGYSWYKSRE